MDFIITFLTQYGYWGMLLAAFLAGSFFPFSSEAVMIALMATGLGWSWSMDGILCFLACFRQCYHHRPGTDAF